MSIFEKASRVKLRFPHKGQCSAEDLWDLSEQDLDAIYSKLQAESKAKNTESLLKTKDAADETLELQIAIVKHVFEVKRDEREEKSLKAEKESKRKKILQIIADKQDSELQNKSVDELLAMADGLK